MLAAAALAQAPDFRATAPLVLVPVSVKDAKGASIDGLTAADFTLTDNGRPVRHTLESTQNPIALVLAIQSTSISEPALAKIRKIGSLIQPLIAGERGSIAVLTYGDRVKLVEDFTGDNAKIAAALRRLKADSPGAALHDAVLEATRRLRALDQQTPGVNRRRVVLLIGESRDRGSRAKLEEAVTAAQAANVMVYPITYSAFATAWTTRGADQQAAIYAPSTAGAGSTGLLGILVEMGRLGAKNGAQALAQFTGGEQLSFLTLKGLERVVARVGEDLHSQYLLSFQPGEENTPEYHRLEVRVAHPHAVVRARPGYWRGPQ
jgi:VWFA-related protein